MKFHQSPLHIKKLMFPYNIPKNRLREEGGGGGGFAPFCLFFFSYLQTTVEHLMVIALGFALAAIASASCFKLSGICRYLIIIYQCGLQFF